MRKFDFFSAICNCKNFLLRSFVITNSIAASYLSYRTNEGLISRDLTAQWDSRGSFAFAWISFFFSIHWLFSRRATLFACLSKVLLTTPSDRGRYAAFTSRSILARGFNMWFFLSFLKNENKLSLIMLYTHRHICIRTSIKWNIRTALFIYINFDNIDNR